MREGMEWRFAELVSKSIVYYEFRAADAEINLGPHVPAYVPLKQSTSTTKTPFIKC
jgi:hypothetical protein